MSILTVINTGTEPKAVVVEISDEAILAAGKKLLGSGAQVDFVANCKINLRPASSEESGSGNSSSR
jgi:hypothetical protein